MSFTWYAQYRPSYQRRHGTCAVCHQDIEARAKIMVGIGYYHKCIIKKHSHYECWIEIVKNRAEDWFSANPFQPRKCLAPEVKAQLNRLRAKRYYAMKGGDKNEIVIQINAQIVKIKEEGKNNGIPTITISEV